MVAQDRIDILPIGAVPVTLERCMHQDADRVRPGKRNRISIFRWASRALDGLVHDVVQICPKARILPMALNDAAAPIRIAPMLQFRAQQRARCILADGRFAPFGKK